MSQVLPEHPPNGNGHPSVAPSTPDAVAAEHGLVAIPPAAQAGLRQLLIASQFAEQLQHDRWDFAVERASLRSEGLTNSDLRWLICQRLVDHAREITPVSDIGRVFRGPAGLRLFRRSCFVLTETGERIAEALASNSLSGGCIPVSDSLVVSRRESRLGNSEMARPEWDGQRNQFRLNGILIKEFKVHSPNQQTILAAFQEEGWPPRIDDPLPMHPEIEPKRRLHDTIKSLNRNQKNRLVHFIGAGSGQAVRWEPFEANPSDVGKLG